MSTLAELREKYQFTGGKYEPWTGCPYCKGTGERRTKSALTPVTFCVCLFVSFESVVAVQESLAKAALDVLGS